jgi:enoyl-CoA hydratase/carnithine racemase
MSETVVFEKKEAVGIITINRPEKDNTIDAQVTQEFHEICRAINIDDSIKAIIITGAGDKVFCRGIDPDSMKHVHEAESTVFSPFSVAGPVADLQCPTICAINGDALGQGMELILACDLRISGDKARFALTMELILTGASVDAAEAFKIGLVTQVVPQSELMSTTLEIAQTMTTKSPFSLSFAKEAINKGMDLTLTQGLQLEADLYFLMHTTKDRTEGIKAFLEKRTPQFKGE